MRLKNLSIALAATLLFASCNNSSKSSSETTDTMATAPVVTTDSNQVAEPAVDSATIKHTEAHAKVKGTNVPEGKTSKSGKKTVVDSDPIIAHHESTTVETPDAEGYYHNPKTWAAFPGGEKALDDFLSKNLQYPDDAADNGIQGTVYVNLYVDETGSVVQAKIPGKKIGYGLEEEVLRVVKQMPKWNPAQNDKTGVKSKFSLPVKFVLK